MLLRAMRSGPPDSFSRTPQFGLQEWLTIGPIPRRRTHSKRLTWVAWELLLSTRLAITATTTVSPTSNSRVAKTPLPLPSVVPISQQREFTEPVITNLYIQFNSPDQRPHPYHPPRDRPTQTPVDDPMPTRHKGLYRKEPPAPRPPCYPSPLTLSFLKEDTLLLFSLFFQSHSQSEWYLNIVPTITYYLNLVPNFVMFPQPYE